MASATATPSGSCCKGRGMYAQPRRRAFVPCRRSNFPKCNCRVCCFIAIAPIGERNTVRRVGAGPINQIGDELLVLRKGRRMECGSGNKSRERGPNNRFSIHWLLLEPLKGDG